VPLGRSGGRGSVGRTSVWSTTPRTCEGSAGATPTWPIRAANALIDALVAHGDPAQVAGQLTAHLTAGADHVCVQLLTAEDADVLEGYRRLAHGLGLSA